MKLLKLSSLILILCVASVAGDRGDGARVGVEVGQGKERKVKGEDLRITFLSVAEDSRCPKGATCVWAGNAKVRLSVRNSKDECAEFELNTNLQPVAYDFGKYTLTLESLSPYPSTRGETRPRDYTAALAVAKKK